MTALDSAPGSLPELIRGGDVHVMDDVAAAAGGHAGRAHDERHVGLVRGRGEPVLEEASGLAFHRVLRRIGPRFRHVALDAMGERRHPIGEDPGDADRNIGDDCGDDEGECQLGELGCIDGRVQCVGGIGPQTGITSSSDPRCEMR